MKPSGYHFTGELSRSIEEIVDAMGVVLSNTIPGGSTVSCHYLAHAMLLCSGYDFGYFVKLLSAVSLPTTEESFFELLNIWFPTVYDIKYMMRASKVLKGGLQDVADDLGVRLIS